MSRPLTFRSAYLKIKSNRTSLIPTTPLRHRRFLSTRRTSRKLAYTLTLLGRCWRVECLYSCENHGEQLRIVKSQNNQISRFAILSRDFQRENINWLEFWFWLGFWHHWARHNIRFLSFYSFSLKPHFIFHFSFFVFRISFFIFHFSFIIFHLSFFIFHFSFFIFHFSFFIFNFSFFIFHFSFFIFHFSFFIFHFSFFIFQVSGVWGKTAAVPEFYKYHQAFNATDRTHQGVCSRLSVSHVQILDPSRVMTYACVCIRTYMHKYSGTYVCTPIHLCTTLLAAVHTYILYMYIHV